ncbi:unnamed protein product, partial [Nesidiocoris tenuis]
MTRTKTLKMSWTKKILMIWRRARNETTDSLCSHMERITVAKVELAQECYLRLCDLFTLLQSAYSAQILFSAGGCFLKTLLNVYSTFSDTQVSSSSGDELMKQQTKTIRTYLWTYYYLARFLVQAVAASATTNQVHTYLITIIRYSNHISSTCWIPSLTTQEGEAMSSSQYISVLNSSNPLLKVGRARPGQLRLSGEKATPGLRNWNHVPSITGAIQTTDAIQLK